MLFLNASVLERKALNRNLSWGFPLGNLLPKTRVLKHRVLERKRRPNANASVLGTQRFRTLRSGRRIGALQKRGRVLKKRGRTLKKRGKVLKKRRLVRRTGGGLLLQKGGVAS